jgi:hypothetical protein
MLNRKNFELVQRILGGACLATLVACAPATGENPSASAGHRVQAIGSNGNLSATEWSTYVADRRYLHGFVKPGARVRLNLADARQYRFVQSRLKLAGKTPRNSPHLFELLAEQRTAHQARGHKAGNVAEYVTSSAERAEQHFIDDKSLGETTAQDDVVNGGAYSTVPDGSYYTWVDVDVLDASNYPLGELGWAEFYDEGEHAPVATTGDRTLTNHEQYSVASFKFEDGPNGVINSYVYEHTGSDDPGIYAGRPRLATPVVNAPTDHKYNDNLISICLNRNWTQDCDYDLTAVPAGVLIPLKGSITVTSEHTFNFGVINLFRDVLNGTVAAPADFDPGKINVVLMRDGGGCPVTSGGTLTASMRSFWNAVTVTVDGKTLSWDLTAANSAVFANSCRQVQDEVRLAMLLPMPLIDENNATSTSWVKLSDHTDGRAQYNFKRIEMTNSCLAEGTQIQLAGGKQAAIESLQSGAQVFNPYDRDDQALTVTDTAKGFETVPMVRIRDAAGRSLLMTEMHPIATADRGMVQARALRTGDVVMTQSGPSKLIEVSRESYDGQVYNLKVGSETEMASLGADQTVVYANGFVVGDGQIQSKYEALAMTQKEGDILDRLPKQWHRDYQQSQQRK